MNQVLLMQGTSVSLPLQDASAQCIVTSPPYFRLRSYLPPGHPLKRYELGRELRHDCLAWARQEPPCAQCYLCRIRTVFAQCRRVLRSDGVMFVVIADSYANEGKWGGRTGGKHVKALHGEALGRQKRQTGLQPKDLCGMPHRLALALQSDGWHWRSDTIWHTVNAFPESMQDRPTRDHEYVLIFRKSARYFWDATAIREAGTGDGWHGSRFTSAQDRATKPGLGQGRRQEQPGRNRRTVWTLPERGSHPPGVADMDHAYRALPRPALCYLPPGAGRPLYYGGKPASRLLPHLPLSLAARWSQRDHTGLSARLCLCPPISSAQHRL